jgi:hypothetical protein
MHVFGLTLEGVKTLITAFTASSGALRASKAVDPILAGRFTLQSNAEECNNRMVRDVSFAFTQLMLQDRHCLNGTRERIREADAVTHHSGIGFPQSAWHRVSVKWLQLFLRTW